MLEWNKCIDKFMNYDSTMIVQSSKFSPTLGDELEEFAEKRGVITNGKVSSLAEAFMFNGDTNKQETDSMEKLKTDKKLASLDEVTVYVSRLADKDDVLKYITETQNLRIMSLFRLITALKISTTGTTILLKPSRIAMFIVFINRGV